MLREVKRRNASYQCHAFDVLGKYAQARIDLDLASTVIDITSPVVEELVASQDEMDVDESEKKMSSSMREDTIAFAAAAAGQSFSALTWQNKTIPSTLNDFLTLLTKANGLQSRHIAVAVMTALGTVLNAVDDGIVVQVRLKEASILASLEKLLFQSLYPSYGADFKLQRAKVIYVVAGLPWGKEVLKNRLESEISAEPTEAVKEELKQARSRLI
jgi:hypothetical protein